MICAQCAPTGGQPVEGCKSLNGGWHCATCHTNFGTNWAANIHATDHPKHQLTWFCRDDGKLEA
jgi:hypothetical protein